MKRSELLAAAWQNCRPNTPKGELYVCYAAEDLVGQDNAGALTNFIQQHIPALPGSGYQPISYSYYWCCTVKPTLTGSEEKLLAKCYADKAAWVQAMIAELQAMGD